MEALGICVGASSVSAAIVQELDDGPKVLRGISRPHGGDVAPVVSAVIHELSQSHNIAAAHCAVTGRRFRRLLRLTSLSEPEAVERAASCLFPATDPIHTIISAGGETFVIYRLDQHGRIIDILTGNKCASGTGEFLLQQLGRMGLCLDDLKTFQGHVEPHPVSGRCSVFCKSDCTHALNKGVDRQAVVAGLARMMAGKCLELFKTIPKNRAALIGGCSRNRFMVEALHESIDQLVLPDDAPWFEAVGAALWALEHKPGTLAAAGELFRPKTSSFSTLPPLQQAMPRVTYASRPHVTLQDGDACLVGLDVGSTTTKGVVISLVDASIAAGVYLRTKGDPVAAARQVYTELSQQIDADIDIIGLGVTGSGRTIAGLHANTPAVINEIVAHATAAVHFDPDVDTIFEIGGQDAKYTHIVHGVPCDYAMNEACSAGTGSFLEEAARETLGVDVTTIADMALAGLTPPNFNDQCAAFISSDIKLATQEGMVLDDIMAGLVYSVAMNYTNRVKGNRPVGKKIFMQGGVCYNRAVPAAMAALIGKDIVVPPDPGLMGAFGVALETAKRMKLGLVPRGRFHLQELAERDTRRKPSFICPGGPEGCDRKCEIARIEIAGTTHPFGGICNRYDNTVAKATNDASRLDTIRQRHRFLTHMLAPEDNRPTVGMNRSYLTHSFLPFFTAFFDHLGYRLVLPEACDSQGVDARGSAICFPGELAHGFMANLLRQRPDILFLPHIKGIPTTAHTERACTCVLVQGEPYYLRSAFPDLRQSHHKILTPVLDFSGGFQAESSTLTNLARQLGAKPSQAQAAFDAACQAQTQFSENLFTLGRPILEGLAPNKAHETPPCDDFGIVLFGRPYNAFAPEANKGIPDKFAMRGVPIIGVDMLPLHETSLPENMNMYWGTGQTLLRAAQYTAAHPNLYPVYITNFSCGPDSFLVSYFRDIMGSKPSLVLELDNHTADAGIETRIEAFLDIIAATRRLSATQHNQAVSVPRRFHPARIDRHGKTAAILTTSGDVVPLHDSRVRVVFPSMNPYSSPLAAAGMARANVAGVALPPADERILKLGRGNSSCKECLPLQLTAGSLLEYARTRPADEITAYFMPSACGPCRFGQYHVFMSRLIEHHAIPNLAVLSPTPANGYLGLGNTLTLAIWQAIIIGDRFSQMRNALLAAAVDVPTALTLLDERFEQTRRSMAKSWKETAISLAETAEQFSAIPLHTPLEKLPHIALVGEIFVRHDPIALQRIVERLAEQGFVVRTAPIAEWIKYTDWLIGSRTDGAPNLGFSLRRLAKTYYDRCVRRLLSRSGLIDTTTPKTADIVKAGSRHLSPQLTGEAILTVGSAFHDILKPASGIISIGPFGCMPSRLSEAILSRTFTADELDHVTSQNGNRRILTPGEPLPFLAIETDGSPFPQIIEARLEAFCLRASRLHRRMRQHRPKTQKEVV
ncbi:acyl-CoA dehydratase activase [Desulfovibrio inopinatus]|uniref:acyl-CoA dehydratase activase n=1 Tax=Desulfovibrio inopinatus TaxID=102109 RepID=UPI0004223696|nr:acyl-CoA dehydratase activase [Desulfovibrio inopinatus]